MDKGQLDWERFARLDAKWAILTRAEKKHHRWDEKEFFATGTTEIGIFLEKLKELGISVSLGEALDFGSGIGRLTQGLGGNFEKVTGVDISQEMIRQAERVHRDNGRLSFVHNPTGDLACFSSGQFDLVYSFITLQHVSSREAIIGYLREFLRVLKPGGVLYFQLPTVRDYGVMRSALLRARALVYGLLVRLGVPGELCFFRLRLAPYMHMNHIPSTEVRALLEPAAAELHIENDRRTDTAYYLRKKE